MADMRASVIMQLIDRVTQPTRRIQSTLSRFSRGAGLPQITDQARRVGAQLDATVGSVRTLSRRLLLFSGVTGAAAFGLNRLVTGVTRGGDEAIKLARDLRMPVEELQELSGAADLVGVHNLEQSLLSFRRRAGEALAGVSGDARDALGFLLDDMDELRDADGNLIPIGEALEVISDRVAEIDDIGTQARIERALFGRGGEGVMRLLRQGSAGIRDLREEVRRAGDIMSTDGARQAEEYNDTLTLFLRTLRGLRQAVVLEILPGLSEWLRRNTALIQANRGIINHRLIAFLHGLWANIATVARVADQAAQVVGGWNVVLAGLGVLLSARVILNVFRLANELRLLAGTILRVVMPAFAGLAKAAIAHPILALITAVGLGALLIIRNWDGVSAWFARLWDAIRDIFGGFLDWLAGVFTGDMERAAGGVRRIWQGLQNFLDTQLDLLGPIGDAIGSVIAWFETNPLTQAGVRMIDDFLDGILDRVSGMAGVVRERVKGLFDFQLPLSGLFGSDGDGARRLEARGPALLDRREGAPVPALPGGGGRSEVSGLLRIQFDERGRPRVRELRREGGDVDLEVEMGSGLMGVGY